MDEKGVKDEIVRTIKAYNPARYGTAPGCFFILFSDRKLFAFYQRIVLQTVAVVVACGVRPDNIGKQLADGIGQPL